MSTITFNKWFDMNKGNSDLVNTYQNCMLDLRDNGEKTISFIQWCRNLFEKEVNKEK